MSLRWDCERDGCYKEKCIPDWGWLEGLLPRNCRPTDIDGIVEIDNRFLILEWKSHGAELQFVQRKVFERLTAFAPDILVVVLYADTTHEKSLKEIQFVHMGKTHDKKPCTFLQFAERYRQWGNGKSSVPKPGGCSTSGCTDEIYKDGLCSLCYDAEQGWPK